MTRTRIRDISKSCSGTDDSPILCTFSYIDKQYTKKKQRIQTKKIIIHEKKNSWFDAFASITCDAPPKRNFDTSVSYDAGERKPQIPHVRL